MQSFINVKDDDDGWYTEQPLCFNGINPFLFILQQILKYLSRLLFHFEDTADRAAAAPEVRS
jgi:hypothetical protein